MSSVVVPPGVVPNYVNPVSRGYEATDAALVSLVLAALFVALRLFTKFCVTHAAGWDDAFSVLALSFAITRLGFIYHIVDLGFGRHIWDVPPENFSGFVVFLATDQIIYQFGIWFAKLTVLALLYRIFSINRVFRWICIFLGVIISLFFFITSVMYIFRCRPFMAQWDINYEILHPHGFTCLNRILMVTVIGWFNIITDFILLFLPMPMLWNMHLTWQKKLGLAFVFTTGVLVCAVAIIRQVILYRNNASGAQETDGTRTEIPLYIWFSLELNIGILCGCLPIVHPLLRRVPLLQDYLPFSLRSLFSSRSRSTTAKSSRSRSKKSTSTRDKAGIELAEEGRAVGKKPSQDSGEATLFDPDDNQFRWPGAIVRTDRYDVRSGDAEEKRRARVAGDFPIIYQG